MNSDIKFEKGTRFLVTGGAGFIGSNICETLLSMGCFVRCLDNLSTGKMCNIEPFMENDDFEFIKGDIRELSVCVDACTGIDYVLHQAAWGSVPKSVEQPLEYNENNITGTLNMMEAARRAKVKTFVYASSAAVYGDDDKPTKTEDSIGQQLSPYAFTKLACEKYGVLYSSLYGLNTVGLRYFNVFGKNQDPMGAYASVIPKFIKEILKGERVTLYGDGGQTRDFVHIDNVVQANLRAALFGEKARGEVFNVAYGDTVTLLEFYDELSRLLNCDERPIFGKERVGDIRHSSADISKIKNLLGYKPTVSFSKGLGDTIEWYKNNL